MLKLKNTEGFSLIEVMIAVGMLSVVALGMMQLSEMKAKQDRTSRINSEIDSFMLDLKGLLGSPGYCLKSVENQVFTNDTGLEFKAIKTPIGRVRYSVGETYLNGSFKLSALEFQNFMAETSDGRDGVATLKVSFEKQGKIYGARQVSRTVEMFILRDESKKIEDCYTVGSTVSSSIARKNTNNLEDVTPDDIKQFVSAQEVEDSQDLTVPKKQEIESIIQGNPNLKKMQEITNQILKANEEMKKRLNEE